MTKIKAISRVYKACRLVGFSLYPEIRPTLRQKMPMLVSLLQHTLAPPPLYLELTSLTRRDPTLDALAHTASPTPRWVPLAARGIEGVSRHCSRHGWSSALPPPPPIMLHRCFGTLESAAFTRVAHWCTKASRWLFHVSLWASPPFQHILSSMPTSYRFSSSASSSPTLLSHHICAPHWRNESMGSLKTRGHTSK